MREEISMTDEDSTQFSTFTMKAKSGTASREKINWREKDYFPRLATVATAYTAIATTGTIVLTAGHGNRVRKGDVLRNMAGGDAFYVTSVSTDTLSVTHIGVKAAAAGAIGDTMLITSNASPQGADFPDTLVLTAVLGFNYTQIVRHGYTFSKTADAVDYYGRSEPDQESTQKGIEHKRAIEYTGFWGARDLKTDATTGEPVGFAGGLSEFIVTNRLDLAGPVTVDNVDTFLRGVLQRSSSNIVMYVSPLAAQQLSKLNRGGQGSAWRADPQNVVGLKVDAFMNGAFGIDVPVIVKKDWNDFPTTLKQYGGWIFVVDHNRVEYKTLTGRSTSLLTARQHPGGDRRSEEWLTELTWEIRNEASHGIMYGIT